MDKTQKHRTKSVSDTEKENQTVLRTSRQNTHLGIIVSSESTLSEKSDLGKIAQELDMPSESVSENLSENYIETNSAIEASFSFITCEAKGCEDFKQPYKNKQTISQSTADPFSEGNFENFSQGNRKGTIRRASSNSMPDFYLQEQISNLQKEMNSLKLRLEEKETNLESKREENKQLRDAVVLLNKKLKRKRKLKIENHSLCAGCGKNCSIF